MDPETNKNVNLLDVKIHNQSQLWLLMEKF